MSRKRGKMMGVYIKDVKMPTCCGDCWALDERGDYPMCRITQDQRGYTFPIREKRMPTCPIVEVNCYPNCGAKMDGVT